MAWKTLLFWLLQYFLLLGSITAGLNTTSRNLIDVDMATIEDLISTLNIAEQSKVSAFVTETSTGQKLPLFGDLKSDWSRLKLLHDALPQDSVIKNKFKHVIRLLIVAHDQATQISHSSQLTTNLENIQKQTTVSVEKNVADAGKHVADDNPVTEHVEDRNSDAFLVNERLKNISTSTTPHASHGFNNTKLNLSNVDLNSTSSKFADSVKTILRKNVTEISTDKNYEKKLITTGKTDKLGATLEHLTTSASNSTLSINDLEELSTISTLLPLESHSDKTMESSTSTHIYSEQTTITLLSKMTKLHDDNYTTSATEKWLREEPKKSSNVEDEKVLNNTTTEMPSSNTTPNKNSAVLDNQGIKTVFSLQTSPTVSSSVNNFRIAEVYSSTATVPNSPLTKHQSISSTPGDPLLLSSRQIMENVSPTQPTPSSKSTGIFTVGLATEKTSVSRIEPTESTRTQSYSSSIQPTSGIQEYSITSDSARNFSINNASIAVIPISIDNTSNFRSPNNQTEEMSKKNSTYIVQSFTDSDSRTPIVTPTNNKDKKRIESQENQTQLSVTKKSLAKAFTTIRTPENEYSIAAAIENTTENMRDDENYQRSFTSATSTMSLTKEITNTTFSAVPKTEKNDKSNLTNFDDKIVVDSNSYTTSSSRETLITRTPPTIKSNYSVTQSNKGNLPNLDDEILADRDSKRKLSTNVTSTTDRSSIVDFGKATDRVGAKLGQNHKKNSTWLNDKAVADKNSQQKSSTEEASIIDISLTTESTKVTLIVSPTSEQDNINNITSFKKEIVTQFNAQSTTEKSTYPNYVEGTSTFHSDFTEETSKKERNKYNPTERLKNNTSANGINIPKRTNHVQNNTSVPPVVGVEVKKILASHGLPSRHSTESVLVTVTTEKYHQESNTPVSKRILSSTDTTFLNNESTPTTREFNRVTTDAGLLINSTKFLFEIKVTDKVATDFVTTQPSTKGLASTTEMYVEERLRITTEQIEINVSQDDETKNKSEMVVNNVTTRISLDNDNRESVSGKTTKKIPVTESTISQSDNLLTKFKPHFEKNPLNAGHSKNIIFQNFKHGQDNTVSGKNMASPQIVLYKTGVGEETRNVWTPQIMRQPPDNNVWRLDNHPNNVPYGYGYRQSAQSINNSKANTRKDEKNPTEYKSKFPSQGGRMNLLRSPKRGSANADIEKPFRWFYRQGHVDPAHKSRDRENNNMKIKIQCKKIRQD